MMKHEKYQHEVGLENKDIISGIDSYVVFCTIWAIGAVCETASRPNFGGQLRKQLLGQAGGKAFKKLAPAFPERGGVFDYCFDLASTTWMPWMDTCEPQTIPGSAKVETITVQTMDNVRYRYILKHCIDHQIKLLFCGPTGTGKTTYMQQSLLGLPKETYNQIFVGFSAKTKCNQTQDLIDSKLDRRRKGVFGPPMGKLAVVFVDDLNMPSKETYGAQPPVEILRQMIDKYAYPSSGGWFDRDDSTHPFKNIVDVLLFAAMGPPGGGRTFITPRINGHMYLVGFPLLDDDNMASIFQTILDWKLQKDGYPGDICSMSKKLVQGTMEMYKSAAAELLPTPLKVHYTFNLRDFAKVIFGVLLMTKDSCEGPDRHIRLWVHEVQRVLGDRLTTDEDRMWMLTQLRDCTKKIFSASFDDIMRHLDNNGDNKVDTLDEIRMLFFADLLSPPAAPKRPYVECKELETLQKEVESHLEQHNMMSPKPMDLVCFLYMLEHLSRVARVVRTPGGNALLVGVGGSGRASCARLAAFLADYSVFQIEIAKGYDTIAFREDCKKLLSQAGGKGENTIFLFSDSQIKDEGFVEDINNLLNTGEIPNLFPPEEKVQICELVRADARTENKAPDGTPSQLYTYFVERCRAKLGIALCFSPIGDAWRSRLRQFPSLVNCCTIDWFTEWPADALQAVAKKFLGTIPNMEQSYGACVEMCSIFHGDSTTLGKRFKDELKRIYYATPTSFLELIQTFKTLLGGKRKEVTDLKSKYEVGLEKLITTEHSVEGMKVELIELQPKLVEKNKEVGEMMVVVNEETAKTEKVKEVVSGDEAAATESANKSNAIKEDCEQQLGEAMPALNASLKALDTLTGKDIAEIKAMKSPPAPVRLVLSGVCIMKGFKPARVKDESGKMIEDYWPIATKMISEMGFLASLTSFDKDNIPVPTIKKIGAYTVQEDFQPDRVEKVSKAAFGLCMWVRAMETYDRVAKVVAPKRIALAEAEEEYAAVMVKLNEKRAELQKVVDQLQKLNDKLNGLKQEQDDLAYQVDLCQKKLVRAESLINGLGGEKTRWSQNAKDLGEDFITLTGDVIVASGIIAYLGAFTPEFREGAVKEWAAKCAEKAIPGSAKFGLEKCLGEPVKIHLDHRRIAK
jgi:dynein heavy chain